MSNQVTPGWYPDPAGIADQRYHDGQGWTKETRTEKTEAATPAAGWYPDPAGSEDLRYYDPSTGWAPTTRPRTAPSVSLDKTLAGTSTRIGVDSTALRLSRRSLAEHAHDKKVLAPTVAKKSTRHVSTAIMAASALFVGAFVYSVPLSNLEGIFSQREAREQLAASVPVQAAPAPVVDEAPTEEVSIEDVMPTEEPTPPPAPVFDREANKPVMPAEGEPVGTIRAESIGLDTTFVSGTAVPDLKKGPGVWEYGVFPGMPGNATISGHRTTYGGPFRHIDDLKKGDRITVTVPGQPDAVFEVRGTVIVEPSRVQVTDNTPGVRLTLTTCDPVGSDAARLVVQAELVEGAWADKAVGADGWKIMQ